MRERPVAFAVEAQNDLVAIHDYVAENTDTIVALGYVQRIERFCLALGDGSERGTMRQEMGQRVRTIGFDRRATIAFTVTDDEVIILRIHYGGRDIEL